MSVQNDACLFTVCVLVISLIATGCLTPAPREPVPVTLEESREIARDHIRAMEEYRDYNGRNLTLTETFTLRCPSCWQFGYSFEMRSMKDPAVTDPATVRVTDIEGTIREVVAAYGSLPS